MHRTMPDGSVISSHCDYCDAEFVDAAMVEGHQGSLVCMKCLTMAFTELKTLKGGAENKGKKCRMCLEERDEALWESPMMPGAYICVRCTTMAYRAMEKDPDSGWKRPGLGVPGVVETEDEGDE